MDIEKLIKQLKATHSPISLSDFKKVDSYFGYMLDHVHGSHYVFRNWIGRKFIIPVHRNKIKAVYLKNFLKDQE